MNDIIINGSRENRSEIMHHYEGFDFIPAKENLSALELYCYRERARER